MSSSQNAFSIPGRPSAFDDLCRGVLRWDLVYPFPQQSPADRERGDEVIAELRGLLAGRLDPDVADAARRLPDGLVDELRNAGFLNLLTDRALDGRELSLFNTFRVISATAERSVALAMILAVQSALGLEAYLDAAPPGPLREFILGHIARHSLAGSADTEPAGAANNRRWTTAVPTEDGAAYLLTGEKVFIGNGAIADVLAVSATVNEDGRNQVRIFFVETSTPGFRVKAWHEFMGLKGFPNGALTLEQVRVPRERMLIERPQERLTRSLGSAIVRGRMYLIAAPSLAISRCCLEYAREFVRRRAVNGRALGDYDVIRRMIAMSLADVFAIDTVAQWCLLGALDRNISLETERVVAKNICSVSCWRVVDRTVSLLAGEGFETAASKARRGAQALPLERLYRDARGLRISGGVDFQMDNWTAQMILLPAHYAAAELPEPLAEADEAHASLHARLSGENRVHLRFLTTHTKRLAQRCRDLAHRHDSAELYLRDWLLIGLGGIAVELFTMALVLARAASPAGMEDPDAQVVTRVYCHSARERIASLWRQVQDYREPDYARLSARWLADGMGRQCDTGTRDRGGTPSSGLQPYGTGGVRGELR